MKWRKLLPETILFLAVSAALMFWRNPLEAAGFGVNFILVANVILFLLSTFAFWVQTRNIHSPSGHAFMRGIYLSVVVKMLLVMTAILIYIVVAEGEVNKKAIFVSMGLYVLYAVFEVYQLMKIARGSGNE